MPGLIDAHVHAYASDVVGAADRGTRRGVPHGARACACSATRSTAASRPCATSAAATTRSVARDRRRPGARAALLLLGQDPVDDRRPRRHPHDRGAAARTTAADAPCGDRSTRFARVADGVDACIRGRARGAAPGRALHQDHGLGRRRLADRPDLDEPVPRGRDPRHRATRRPSAAATSPRTATRRARCGAASSSACARSSTAR